MRHSRLDDTSVNNFAGTYVFYSLAQYKAVLMQLPDAGASQFSRAAGTPEALVRQTDAGLFVTGDWRTRPNLTLSFGLRYEVQSNLGGRGNWAPRIAIAWGLDARSNRPAKTELSAWPDPFAAPFVPGTGKASELSVSLARSAATRLTSSAEKACNSSR